MNNYQRLRAMSIDRLAIELASLINNGNRVDAYEMVEWLVQEV